MPKVDQTAMERAEVIVDMLGINPDGGVDRHDAYALLAEWMLRADTAEAELLALRARVEALAAELEADYNRPEGRWGMHGYGAVDDDYFIALEYCLGKIRRLLAEPQEGEALGGGSE
jgi:hypothetical protein